MTSKEKVLERYPDAEIYVHILTNGSFSVGSESVGFTISAAKWTREEAWEDAAERIAMQESEK